MKRSEWFRDPRSMVNKRGAAQAVYAIVSASGSAGVPAQRIYDHPDNIAGHRTTRAALDALQRAGLVTVNDTGQRWSVTDVPPNWTAVMQRFYA